MTAEAILKRREYNRAYRELNKDAINTRHKQWRDKNKDKIKQYNVNYWTKKAQAV